MASPYSDYTSGLSPLPTVVADYNRSYDNVNTDGPHLILTEQPQGKFRFRYKSEMVGTHGQLKAERADRNKAIFPTVKLVNWTDGPALIRLMLYTGEDNPSQRRRHVHELSGKNCDKDTGMCEVVVDHTTDYTATFQNLGIVHIAKREVKDIIRQRKKAELIEHARMRRPHCTHEEIRQSITPTDMKKFDEEAEEIAKTMDLNKVVLRFQAFQYDTAVSCYRPITRSVDSEMVVNLKNASTGELKIVRMSECSAPCTGGTEVWMLVEKVKKSNIKIKFFEMDNDGNEVWSAYGVFSEGDVHHQYAIIFRTPPYRTTNLRSSVRVKVQLERPNDKDISEPRDFTYYPESRKRQSPFPESAKVEEDEDYPQGGGSRSKRLCQGSTEPLDLRFIGNGRCPTDGDIIEALALADYYSLNSASTGEDGYGTDYRSSPQYTVPSPNHPGESPNSNTSQSFYVTNSTDANSMDASPFLQVPSENGSQIQVMVGSSSYMIASPNGSLGDPLSPQYQPSSSPKYQVPSPLQVSSPQYQVPSPQQVVYQQSPSPVYQQSSSPVYQQSAASPQYQFSPSISDHLVPNSPNHSAGATDTLIGAQMAAPQQVQQQQMQQQMIPQIQLQVQQPLLQQQQQQRQPQQQTQQRLQNSMGGSLNTPTIPSQTGTADTPSEGYWDFSNLVQGTSSSGIGDLDDLVDPISLETINPDFFTSSDLQTDCFVKKGPVGKNNKKTAHQAVDALTRSLASVSLGAGGNGKQKEADRLTRPDKGLVAESVDVAFRVAVSAAESLQAYAATGDMGRLLATHRYLLAVQNNQGDNALHTAVSNKNWDAFNKILKAATNLRPQDLLNMQNYAGETALHLAVRGGDLAMTTRLVSSVGSDVSLSDRGGNTPLHLAAALPPSAGEIMATLLRRPVNGARSALETALQAYNYQGETALHVAVAHRNLSVVRQLVGAGADAHACERRRGANCLHLAAQHKARDIAMFLIQHTTIAVNARMFDGNTALHVAVQGGDAALCRMLLEAGADPLAKNALKIRRKPIAGTASAAPGSSGDEEEDEDDEEEEDEEEDEEEEPNCHTPFDYVGDNVEVLGVLHASYGSSSAKGDAAADSCNALDSGIDVSASNLSSSSIV